MNICNICGAEYAKKNESDEICGACEQLINESNAEDMKRFYKEEAYLQWIKEVNHE